MSRRLYVSLSALGPAEHCPAAGCLLRFPSSGYKSDYGSAWHELLATQIKQGKAAMLETFDEVCERWKLPESFADDLRVRAERFDPQIPNTEHTHVELALCMLESGRVVQVEGGRGQYAMPEDAVFAGTIDTVWAESLREDGSIEVVAEADHKTGEDRFRVSVEQDMQALGSAVLAAEWTNADAALPFVLYTKKGLDGWECRKVVDPTDGQAKALPYDRRELDEIEGRIRRIVADVRHEATRLDNGETPRFNVGPHCGSCGARKGCPAYLHEVNALVHTGAVERVREHGAPLTRDEAQKLATWLPQAVRVVAEVRAALVDYVDDNGAIPIGDGRVWGAAPSSTTDILDMGVALAELAGIIGEDAARKALGLTVESVKAAIKDEHDRIGIKRKVAPTLRKWLAILHEQGAAMKTATVKYQVHHPKLEDASNGEEDAA